MTWPDLGRPALAGNKAMAMSVTVAATKPNRLTKSALGSGSLAGSADSGNSNKALEEVIFYHFQQ